MTTWQPPIPAGALYSKHARQLGPALALLAYCYDLVQTDGWLEIVLKDAAGDMQEPYQNVKRWWHLVKAGPFFCEAIDRGKLGWRVKFKDVWIDWRILKARAEQERSSTNEGSEMVLESGQVQMKYKSSTNQGPEMVLEKTAYKDDIHDQESRSLRASRAPPSSDHQKLLAAYQDALGYKIPNGGKEGPAAKKILDAGYTIEQTIDVYGRLKAGYWADKHLSLHKVYEELGAVLRAPKVTNNGTYQNGRREADRRPDLATRRSRKRLDRDDSG